jgi:hypothetical protein
MSISVASCTIKENWLQLRRGLNRIPAVFRLLQTYLGAEARRPMPCGRRVAPSPGQLISAVNERCEVACRIVMHDPSKMVCEASCHQTIVNAFALYRRAVDEKYVDRRVRRMRHRQNFSQTLLSVPAFPVVLCIV